MIFPQFLQPKERWSNARLAICFCFGTCTKGAPLEEEEAFERVHILEKNDTTHYTTNCDEEELHDIEVEYAAVEDMQLSNDEMVIPSIPELPSQEILTTSLSQMSQPSLLTSATNKECTPNTQLRAMSTSKMKTYKLSRGKRQVSASAKAADSLIQ
ncbi:hypothetical protein AVEN_173371-1 [Araneus ventricosus]|uniref:Uncharacterized protein n=1 Tax=Araneus ventricosus TaxID=182803 RepID=A0A4Y2NIT8_ARAVE|nr:hypothetical protein AVEN_173371-1 [Araneus ventricosus]